MMIDLNHSIKLMGLIVSLFYTPTLGAQDKIHRYESDPGRIHLTNMPQNQMAHQKEETGHSQSVHIHLKAPNKSARGPAHPTQNDIKTGKHSGTKTCPKDSKYMSLIDEVTQNYGIDPALIKALIRVESNFNSEATSKKGAQGLMQLMPHTAQRHQVKDPYDPKDNIEGGIKYLLQLIEAYDQDLDLALAAYNAGPPAVEKYQGVPPFAETQKFVRDIQSYQACFAQDGSGSRK